jgi:hypothetical protein
MLKLVRGFRERPSLHWSTLDQVPPAELVFRIVQAIAEVAGVCNQRRVVEVMLGFAVESKASDDSVPKALYYVPAVKAGNNHEGWAAWRTAKANMPKLRALFSSLGCPTEFHDAVIECVERMAARPGWRAAAGSTEEAEWMVVERAKAVNKQKATKYANDKATSRLDNIEKRIQKRNSPHPRAPRALGGLDRGEPWEAQLARLAAYKWQHGDCNVPQGWAEDPRLGRWVRTQRSFKKQLDRGVTGLGMTVAWAARLEALGFAWAPVPKAGGAAVPNEGAWEAQLVRLVAYKQAHGDCNVPKYWAEDPPLGNWVSKQRGLKRVLDRGGPSEGMTVAWAAQLEALGFAWGLARGTRAVGSEGAAATGGEGATVAGSEGAAATPSRRKRKRRASSGRSTTPKRYAPTEPNDSDASGPMAQRCAERHYLSIISVHYLFIICPQWQITYM